MFYAIGNCSGYSRTIVSDEATAETRKTPPTANEMKLEDRPNYFYESNGIAFALN